MPGASKFYRSSGAQALVRQQLTLAPQATLEWLPQDAIFFPGANARLFTTFHLCASSRLLAWDLLCLEMCIRDSSTIVPLLMTKR